MLYAGHFFVSYFAKTTFSLNIERKEKRILINEDKHWIWPYTSHDYYHHQSLFFFLLTFNSIQFDRGAIWTFLYKIRLYLKWSGKKLLKVSFSFIYMIFVSFIVLCFVLCQWKSKKKKWKLTHKWSNVNNDKKNRKMVIVFLGCFDHEINDDLVRSCVHHVYVYKKKKKW